MQQSTRIVYSVIVKYLDRSGEICLIMSYVEEVINPSILPRYIIPYMEENGYQLKSLEINSEETTDELPKGKTVDKLFPLGQNTRYQCGIRFLSSNNEYIVRGFLTFPEIEHWVKRTPVPKSDSLVLNFGKCMVLENVRVRQMTEMDIEGVDNMVQHFVSLKGPNLIIWSINDW